MADSPISGGFAKTFIAVALGVAAGLALYAFLAPHLPGSVSTA